MGAHLKNWLRNLLKPSESGEVYVGKHEFFLQNEDKSFWGSITEEDEQAVIDLVRKAATLPGPIIEIGALFGLTTQLIATHKPVDKPLITVENYSWNPFDLPPAHHRILLRRVLRYALTHASTQVFEGTSAVFYETYRGERPCLVFIDADHTYEGVKADIDWAKGAGVSIISGHDYGSLQAGVKRAVEEAFPGKFEVRGSVWWHVSV